MHKNFFTLRFSFKQILFAILVYAAINFFVFYIVFVDPYIFN